MTGNFACCFIAFLRFFFKLFFNKILSVIVSECQTGWIRPDVLLGLIWVGTDCKGYHQMTKVTSRQVELKLLVSET